MEPDILDVIAEAEALRDEGMAAVTEASDTIAVNAVDQLIAHLNATGEPWSANSMRGLLPDHRHPLIGARIRAAATRKQMVKVGYEPSNLPSTHGHEIKVWRGVS